ncbi:MAG TPA: DUF4349 domain-containing protein [Terriglobales bacterium]|jgi:hypothetical protein
MERSWGEVLFERKRTVYGFAGLGLCLILAAISMPQLKRVTPMPQLTSQTWEMAANKGISAQMYAGTRPESTASLQRSTTVTRIVDRKIARTTSMQLVVTNAVEGAEKIRKLAENAGGYVESSTINGSQSDASADVTILVPSTLLPQTQAKLRELASRVASERTNAADMTKQTIDLQARLRNLRAEEMQYLQIMQRASKVTDMIEVGEKLSEVRGEIEQSQAEADDLAKQVDMASIAVSLRPQPQAEAFSLNWHPLQRLKLASADALDGLASYAGAMASFLLFLPVICLWVATIMVGGVLLWRGIRLAGRFFPISRMSPVENAAR